jgi:AcrR family transcriptional regulator
VATAVEVDRSPRRRLRADDRREQLLDAAAAVIVAHGTAAMSMERLAAEAGVSKALPYKHFPNSDAVLAALYRRETEALGVAVWRALRSASADADLPRLAIGVYLDEVQARRPVLAALSRPGSTIAAVADPDQAGVIFEVEVFHRFFGVDRRRAKAVAGMVQGAIVGAVGTWLAGHARRATLEADLVAVITTLVQPREPGASGEGS